MLGGLVQPAAAKISPTDLGMVINHNRTLADLLQHYANVYRIVFAIEDGRKFVGYHSGGSPRQARLYLLPMGGKSIEAWSEEFAGLRAAEPGKPGRTCSSLYPPPMSNTSSPSLSTAAGQGVRSKE